MPVSPEYLNKKKTDKNPIKAQMIPKNKKKELIRKV
jgi:hypothetical protein